MKHPHRRPTTRQRKFSWKKLAVWVLIIGLIFGSMFAWRQFFVTHSKWVPAKGGIYTEATVGAIKNLNPLAPENSLLDRDLHELIFAGLLRHNPLTGQIEDNLATFRVSESGKIYHVTIKDSAKFSNGDPVSIKDVKFTFEKVIQNPNFSNKVLHNAFEYISIDIVDEQTLAFNLPEPNIYFPGLLTTPILHADSFKDALIEEITDQSFPANRHPIGAGPYELRNIVPENNNLFRVFLGSNKHYFRGEPLIPQVVFYAFNSSELLQIDHPWPTAFSNLNTRDVDLLSPQLFGEYAKREYVLPRFVGIFMNLDAKNTQNIALRNALKLGVDKERLLARENGWNRIDSIFFFEGVEDWHEPGYGEARQLLRDNGFRLKEGDEFRTFDNKPLTLRMITSIAPPVYSRFAQSLVRNWRTELGINVELSVLNPAEFQRELKTRNYDLALFGQNFSGNLDSLSTWHSSQSGDLNLSNLTNSEVDFLIDEVRFSDSRSDLFALNQKLNEIIPAIVIATPQYHFLVDHNLLGFSKNFGKIRSHSERFKEIQKWHYFKKRDWDWPREKSKFTGFFRWMWEGLPL